MGNRVYMSGYDPRRDLVLGPKPLTNELAERGLCGPELETKNIVPFGWLALFDRDSIAEGRRDNLWLVTTTERARERLAARRRALYRSTNADVKYVLHAFELKLVPSLQPAIALRLDELVWTESPGRFVHYLRNALEAMEDPKRLDMHEFDWAIERITGAESTAGALYGYGKNWPPPKTQDEEDRDYLLWELERFGLSEDSAYSPSRTYGKGDALVHPTFGFGIVENVLEDRMIEVLFEKSTAIIQHSQT